jgi:parvulin-like peptidyl-prolyl isomerase
LLRLDTLSLAQEFYLQIAHNEANFGDLAGTYSQGPERNTKGVVGPAPLIKSHPILMEKLRAATPGRLLEPFELDKWWLIARLEKIAPATFDEQMADKMSVELFQEWLKQETHNNLEKLNFNNSKENQS